MQKQLHFREEKIKTDLEYIAESLVKMYRRDRVYVEVSGKKGDWLHVKNE